MDNNICACSLRLSGCLGMFPLDSSFEISKDKFFGPCYLDVMEEWKKNKTLEVSEKVRVINLIRQKVLRYPIIKPICPECTKVARRILGKNVAIPWRRVKPVKVAIYLARKNDYSKVARHII